MPAPSLSPRPGRVLLVAALLLLCSAVAGAERPPPGDDVEALLSAAVEASGGSDAANEQRVRRALAEIVERLGGRDPGYRHARKLHRTLHRRYLREYAVEADSVTALADNGRFNCVSGVLFYGLAARALGYGVEVLETPGHLMLRVRFGDREIDVEATSPLGFDVAPVCTGDDPARSRVLATHSIPRHAMAMGRSTQRMELDDAVGFLWLNRAWRALEQRKSLLASRLAARGYRMLPDGEPQAGDVGRLLTSAFRNEYEAGRFDDAYAIATTDVGLFPASTTSRDRVLAAALKRIEIGCDSGRPEVGERILGHVGAIGDRHGDLTRLERRTWPIVAAAAVRIESWALAARAAERYSMAEPDPIEARRLVEWVATRRERASTSAADAR